VQRVGAFVGLQMTLVLVAMVDVCVAAGPPVAPASISELRDKVAAAVARDVPSSLAGQDAGNLQVLDPLLSLPSDSQLRVTSVRTGYSPGSWLLRLECASRRDCLPFHVVLRAPGVGRRESFGADLAAKAAGKDQPSRPQTNPAVARSGDHVLLVEERSGMRLKVTAVCLQSGGLGDQIRVRNLATQRVLVATIAGKNLVRVE
jgi:flagellar basal body P-ring formation chaperone FlgA